MLRRMGVGKGAVTDGPMPMLMKKDDLLNLPEDECIIVTFRMPSIKDKKICTKKQIDYFSPDSNVVACSCKPFRDRQADRWDISLSVTATDSICRTSLDSRCKEDPGKR